ncbi:class I SAM-dependent methyltransferase [Pedobacter heparinus]|uniref:Methyltransferase type 11 n=1 Tax=Pedobacter heparinus (strain ATCC 13125 / DSM 2366 / CIP 104194 / JCM 7457 / NBRC 12017 / NCIMB 9290 / NRRL B-14731 / HIM 762-3) TaxID=485917 RepID=C6Y227_PEDHD|nr:class I SAM-dependent methyltransferase [Pedobacter heparinus]ACU03020.1 Methyltransferase type 11 [Pedobacter heparinus DSM 2366]
MKEPLSEEVLMYIASQLSKPEGADGILTAERMAHTNNNMTNAAIKALNIVDKNVVLEIGPGNGRHVMHLMSTAAGLRYYGVDISDTMITEAHKINERIVSSGQVSFGLTSAAQLNFTAGFFDRILTVNTLYFWENPLLYAREVLRVLKPGGVFCLAIATAAFMKGLPFTKYKFKLYEKMEVEQLLKTAGFAILNIVEEKDLTTSHTGDEVDRDIILVTATKDKRLKNKS